MRRRYINFLLAYFHNSSKKAHATAACPAVNVNARLQESSNQPICQARRLARHVLVRPSIFSADVRDANRRGNVQNTENLCCSPRSLRSMYSAAFRITSILIFQYVK